MKLEIRENGTLFTYKAQYTNTYTSQKKLYADPGLLESNKRQKIFCNIIIINPPHHPEDLERNRHTQLLRLCTTPLKLVLVLQVP